MNLDDADKAVLADFARQALRAAVTGGEFTPDDPEREQLDSCGGVFVTLRTHGDLRGCIGCFTSENPLWQTVPEYTRLSALDDPRFVGRRLTARDLPDVEMDISVLSPLEPCAEPENIVLGKHGIYVMQGRHSGCFLPSVATETGWNVDEFWSHCCREKAGLAPDAWRKPDTECYIFTADVIDCPA